MTIGEFTKKCRIHSRPITARFGMYFMITIGLRTVVYIIFFHNVFFRKLSTPDMTDQGTFRMRPEVRYAFVNSQPITYDIGAPEEAGPNTYTVSVAYTHNIRFIGVSLLFVNHQQDTRYHRMLLLGFLPRETYVFETRDGVWTLAEVRQGRPER